MDKRRGKVKNPSDPLEAFAVSGERIVELIAQGEGIEPGEAGRPQPMAERTSCTSPVDGSLALLQEAGVQGFECTPMLLKLAMKFARIVAPHESGHGCQGGRIGWQLMGLLVPKKLAAMLQPAKKLVSVRQVLAYGVVEDIVTVQRADGVQGAANAKIGGGRAVEQLENLNQELNVANAAAAALQVPFMRVLLDPSAHRKHRLKCRLAKLGFEARGFSEHLPARGQLLGTADDPGSEQRLNLPWFGVSLVVRLDRRHRLGERAGRAVGSQA